MAASSRYQSARPESISFPQFRDYLLLLPRKPSVNEVRALSAVSAPLP
jgi:hypothetical protein